jgi:hypothetical protein
VIAVVLLVLFAALLAIDLWRRSRGVPGEMAMAILLAGFPRALLVAAAALSYGGWQLRMAIEGIAVTGSGGLPMFAEPVYELIRISLAGAIACIALLSVSVLLVWRARAIEPAAPVTPAPAGASWLRALGVGLGCACVGYGLMAAERAAMASVIPFLDRLAVPTPPAFADLPSSPELLIVRLIMQLSIGGLILSLVLTLQAIATGFDLKRGSLPAGVRVLLPVLASAMVLFAAWRSVHLGTAIGWLSGVFARIG